MARALELSEEQKAAFRELLEQQRSQIQALREQMHENHQKLTDALEGDDPDPAAIGQLVIQGQALRKQAEALRKQGSQALRALLTPEQRTKFDALNSLREHAPFGLGDPGFGTGGTLPGGRGGRPPGAPEE
jgi:Spy/CpxP family protein refolding chaperone